MNASEIKEILVSRIEDVIVTLLPNGKRHGNYWHIGSVNGEAGDSMKVCVAGPKAGVWIDGATSESGDIMKLWCCVRGLPLRDCLPEIRKYLNIPEIGSRIKHQFQKEYKKPDASKSIQLTASAAAPVTSYLVKDRLIPMDVLKANHVMAWPGFRTQSTEYGNCIVFNYMQQDGDTELVKLVSLVRNDRGKKRMLCFPGGKPMLFGMDSPVVKSSHGILVICEGEIDALSWQAEGVPAVSVPFGAKGETQLGGSPNDEWIENSWDFLDLFHTIYICPDMDEEGSEMATCIARRLGKQRCLIVSLPKKDANECRVSGVALKPLLMTASEADMVDIKSGEEIYSDVMDDNSVIDENSGHPFMGWDLKLLDSRRRCFNIRPYEGTVVTGFANHGKSNALYQYIAYVTCRQKKKVFIGSYEEGYRRTARLMSCHALGKKVELATPEEKKALREQLFANIWVHDFEGSVNIEKFFEYAEYAVRRCGVEEVFLDCVQSTSVNMDDKEDMANFAKRCQAFWKSTGVHFWAVFHPRKGINELQPPGKNEVSGSASVQNLFFNVITFHRLFDDEAGDGRFIISKQKVGGQWPDVLLKYNPDNYRVYPVGQQNPNAPYIQLTESATSSNDEPREIYRDDMP